MHNILRCLLFAALTAGLSSTALAGELKLTMKDGRVTVIAQDVPLRQILAEWARVGDTKMVNAEKLTGGPVTIQLIDVPEKEALDTLLRSAAGYLTAARSAPVDGASTYDRVIILATSRPPTGGGVTTPPPFGVGRQPTPVPLPQPVPDGEELEPGDPDVVPPPMQPPGGQPPGAQPFPGPAVGPDGQPIVNVPSGQPFPGPQAPVTSPRPGQLPVQPQPQQINPYTPVGPDGRPIVVPGRPGGRQDDQ